MAALLAVHSSLHCLAVFCWAAAGIAAKPSIAAEQTRMTNRRPIVDLPLTTSFPKIEEAQQRLGSVSLALFHMAGLCGARQRLAVFATRAVFAAFLDGTGPRWTGAISSSLAS